jgi:hypothetical protein
VTHQGFSIGVYPGIPFSLAALHASDKMAWMWMVNAAGERQKYIDADRSLCEITNHVRDLGNNQIDY